MRIEEKSLDHMKVCQHVIHTSSFTSDLFVVFFFVTFFGQ